MLYRISREIKEQPLRNICASCLQDTAFHCFVFVSQTFSDFAWSLQISAFFVIVKIVCASLTDYVSFCPYLRPHSGVQPYKCGPRSDWWSGGCHCLHHALSSHRPRKILNQTQRYISLSYTHMRTHTILV